MSRPRIVEVFDAAAEALVLVDVSDATTVEELVERLVAVTEALDVADDTAHPACIAVDCARRLAEGDTSVLPELERAYGTARSAAERAAAGTAAPAQRPARSTRTSRASKPAGGSDSAPPATATGPGTMPLAGDEELLRDFAIRAGEHMDDADSNLLALESDPGDADAVDAVFRSFHTVKGMAGFLALDDISEHAHASESLLAEARANQTAVAEEAIQALFSAVDRMRELIFEATGIGGRKNNAAERSSAEQLAEDRRSGVERRASAREGTVRVEEHRLDGLLDAIGEMVIAESMVSASLRRGLDSVALASQLDRLDKITRELQQMATSLRMVPLKATFRRMSRLVRDLAHKADKQIELVLVGEDTELDKEVVDRISDPLVHALRNAVDHGIESPEERVAAGKPAAGRIELRAHHAGGAIHIEVADDGRGLDPQRILARGRERGLVAPDATPDERALFDLVFEPGFSTAETVTDVSGRGVGMDVVRRTIDELRGRIELDSAPGEGTTLSVRLPITLAIIDGMVVRVGEERYVVPVLAIERSVRPDSSEVASVQGAGEMLVTEEGLVPIVKLHRLFGTDGAVTDPTQAVVIITSDNGIRAGLMVCELLGQQQTVIKPLGSGIEDQRGITGGAIMPDGQVGLILDATGLVRLAREQGNAARGAQHAERT
jgi:two-component system chemotaxis sensor kinase CheA